MARKNSSKGVDPPRVIAEGGSIRVEARVLVEFQHEGKKIGADSIFVADSAIIEQYAKDGLVDPHVDAVAYVKSLKA